MIGSRLCDIWIVIVACGECVFPLTADLFIPLHFVLDYIYFAFYDFFLFISLACGAGYQWLYKHINPFFSHFPHFPMQGSES